MLKETQETIVRLLRENPGFNDISGTFLLDNGREARFLAAARNGKIWFQVCGTAEIAWYPVNEKADPMVYGEWTHDELKAAFARVSDPEDWKGPVGGDIDPGDLERVVAAVEYFTATRPTVKRTVKGYCIQSIGYRAGPAGP